MSKPQRAIPLCCLAVVSLTAPAVAAPIWPQPGGPGTPVLLTYSYSNLLDGGFNTPLSARELRDVVEEALGLWAAHAPLHFFERPDSGPLPAPPVTDEHGNVFELDYPPANHPDIRVGYHDDVRSGSAHAGLPPGAFPSGVAGDVHFRNNIGAWGFGDLQLPLLEVMTHELGHSVGLLHILDADAIMNPFASRLFAGPGTGFLLASDIAAIQELYGAGRGTVNPIPEPSTLLLLALSGVVLGLIRTARR